MRCPYCGKEMEFGYITSGHPFLWGPTKEFGAFLQGRIRLSKGFWNGCSCEAYVCHECGKLIADLPEKKK